MSLFSWHRSIVNSLNRFTGEAFRLVLDMTESNPAVTRQLFAETVHPVSHLDVALMTLLSAVCARTGWEYGEVWIPDDMHQILELSPVWCLNTNLEIHQAIAWMQFQICSKAFVLRLAEGLPGRVWDSQQPEWMTDASAHSETYFLRNQIARAFSVRAGFGVPLISNARVWAVVVFFMSEARSEDKQLAAQTTAAIAEFRQLVSIEAAEKSPG